MLAEIYTFIKRKLIMAKTKVTQEFLDENPELAAEHGFKVGDEFDYEENSLDDDGGTHPTDPKKPDPTSV